jgi:hypothetical protein
MKGDKSHGFYSYRNTDGSVLSTRYHWHGFLHGLSYHKFWDGEEEYRLYENDKLIRTFTAEEVRQIKAGTLDWTTFFSNPSSKINMVPNQTFDGPSDWQQRVNNMLQQVRAATDNAKSAQQEETKE